MRGRKPKPSFLRVIDGNRGRRRAPGTTEPVPESAIPTVPAHLSDEAKVEWGRVSNELHELGLLTRIDRAMLAAYCQAYGRWVAADTKILEQGEVISSPVRTVTKRARDGSVITEQSGGYPMQSPYLAISNKAQELMYKFAVEFGLSPSSRSRVGAHADKPRAKDKAQKYFD